MEVIFVLKKPVGQAVHKEGCLDQRFVINLYKNNNASTYCNSLVKIWTEVETFIIIIVQFNQASHLVRRHDSY